MPLDRLPVRGVLFDLDGTFADTAPDLAEALNHTLRVHGRAPLPFDAIRAVVSHGGAALIRLGFGEPSDAVDHEPKRRTLLDFYQANICRHTRLFEGMHQVLEALEARAIPWGIVTNKPAWLTDPLMAALGMNSRAGSVVSGDTCANAKPHPEPILYACRQMGVPPERCLYVGDAARDIEAGRAAGATTVAALYGYLLPEDDVDAWCADACIRHPEELLALLGLPGTTPA